MKTTRFLSVLILAGWLTCSAAHGQQPAYEQPAFPPPSPFGAPSQEAPAAPPRIGLSDWILYRRDCCDGPLGKLCPLYTEIYFNGGASVPIARGTSPLANELQTGWVLMGGARALFFNEPLTKAWVIDAHIINIHQYASHTGGAFPMTVTQPVTGAAITSGVNNEPNFNLEDMNRFLVGLGAGRDWYLWHPANYDGNKLRVGIDAGGRYGSERLNVVNGARSAHVTDVVGGPYLGAHCDLEMPCRYALFHAGLRLEWAYTFTDVLQQPSNVQELNLLLTVGIRF